EQLHRARRHAHRVRTAAVKQAITVPARATKPRRDDSHKGLKDHPLRKILGVAAIILAASVSVAAAEANDPTAVKNENGKYLDKEGNPTFHVAADGAVDWYTYSGYR